MRQHRRSLEGSSVRGTVTVQSEIVGQGRHAARFDLPAAANAYTACETLHKRLIDLGSDDYYGLMVRFPDDSGASPHRSAGASRSHSSTSRTSGGRR